MDFDNIDELGTGIPISANPKPQAAKKGKDDDGPAEPLVEKPPATYGGISEFAPPPVAAGGSVEVKSADALDQKRFASMLALTILTTLVIGGVAVYATISFLQQAEAAKKQDDPFERYKQIKVPTRPPTPTRDPAANGVAVVPTEEPSPTPEPSPAVTWEMTMDKNTILISDLEDPKLATLTATLKATGLEENEYVCIEVGGNNHQYFTKKKTADVFEKVCSEEDRAKDIGLECHSYDPNVGIVVKEPILPSTACTESNRSISAGTYVLYTKVFSDCNLEARATRQVRPLDCKTETEVYSNEFTIE